MPDSNVVSPVELPESQNTKAPPLGNPVSYIFIVLGINQYKWVGSRDHQRNFSIEIDLLDPIPLAGLPICNMIPEMIPGLPLKVQTRIEARRANYEEKERLKPGCFPASDILRNGFGAEACYRARNDKKRHGLRNISSW